MEYRTRVKFCGITKLDDALLAVELGVDALGFVFYAQSPRSIDPRSAQTIIEKLPAFVTTVGLFVDTDSTLIEEVLAQAPIDVVQFHGSESPAQCATVSRPYIKAIRMAPDADLQVEARNYSTAQALLVDTYSEKSAGGTGSVFDWNRIPAQLSKPVILAGGLGPDNVAAAIRSVRPFAVDVSSGIECDYGIKDREKMQHFMREVANVEC
jgi:phosphoribosylanthranilate isomerase